MADGWLFRLRSTLGARHAVPAWPASSPLDPSLHSSDLTSGQWIGLHETRPATLDAEPMLDAALEPPLRRP